MNGVSVIVPLYNREIYIRECLESILAQERDFPMEIIVCDDGSTDNGPALVQAFGDPVRFFPKPEDCRSQGPGPTRNRGITYATGNYITFLDSDDVFLPGHLKRLHAYLQTHPEFNVVTSPLSGFLHNPAEAWTIPFQESDQVTLQTMFLNPYLSLQASLFRKETVKKTGEFDESLLMGEDIDFFLRLLEQNNRIAIITEPGTAVREHAGRSINDLEKCYQYAEQAMLKAVQRHPYPKKLVRKRKAVIQFRYAQAAIGRKKYGSASIHLIKAFLLDPTRSLAVLFGQR